MSKHFLFPKGIAERFKQMEVFIGPTAPYKMYRMLLLTRHA